MVPGRQDARQTKRPCNARWTLSTRMREPAPAGPTRGPRCTCRRCSTPNDIDVLAAMYREARRRATPNDEEALNGLIQVYARLGGGHLMDALSWYERKGPTSRTRIRRPQYAVGVYVWQQLFCQGRRHRERPATTPRLQPGQKKAPPAPRPSRPDDIVGQQTGRPGRYRAQVPRPARSLCAQATAKRWPI